MNTIQERVQKLPPELRREVEDFVDFLIEKRSRKIRSEPTFAWAGALHGLKDRCSSVELQHRISGYRGADS